MKGHDCEISQDFLEDGAVVECECGWRAVAGAFDLAYAAMLEHQAAAIRQAAGESA